MDQSENRLNEVFFYGLYMDPEVLKAKGVEPRQPRKAVAKGYRLRIGKMATLFRDPAGEAHGIVYALSHEEVSRLYWGAGIDPYVAEAVLVESGDGEPCAALCCVLRVPPDAEETNPDYRDKLMACMGRLGLPLPEV